VAGHSKWSNIKHRKAQVDQKRGKIFTKVIREIVVAAAGGANPEDNPKLRAAIDKALAVNMKRDTIDRAIDRGSGNSEQDNYEAIAYEGYAPYSVAVLVDCLTDNKNRTVAEVRHLFSKFGGNLGVSGSVSYLFKTIGQIYIDEPDCNEEVLMEQAIEAGAEDIIAHMDAFEVVTTPELYLAVKQHLANQNFTINYASINKVADTTIELSDDQRESILNFIDKLEDLDDVQEVYTNLA